MQENKFSVRKRIKSFGYAFNGLATLVGQEHNARIHLAAAIAAIAAGLLLGITTSEWIMVVGCIAVVIAAEAFNSAIEALCDLVSPERHSLVKKTKDLSAAAVLVCAAGALVIGLIIFVPYLMAL